MASRKKLQQILKVGSDLFQHIAGLEAVDSDVPADPISLAVGWKQSTVTKKCLCTSEIHVLIIHEYYENSEQV